MPSGWTKNFTRSPGFKRRCSRIAFGIVAWPLTVIADSMFPHYIIINVIPRRSTGVKLCRQPQRGDLTKPRPPAWVEKFTPLGFASPERA